MRFKFPRLPVKNSGVKTTVSVGPIGIWINGVNIFGIQDGQSYKMAGIWRNNAFNNEKNYIDNCNGLPQKTGLYHQDVLPVCLFNSFDSTRHSPLIGFAFDGFPIYGPFGYSDSFDSTSQIKRILPSYRQRNILDRTQLPNGVKLSSSEYGPPISSAYPLGAFIEDYEYVEGFADLDENNGRFCITPEYPKGTYAYFVATDLSGNPVYPYVIGTSYYGYVVTENMFGNVIPKEATVTYFDYFETDVISSSSLLKSNLVLYLILFLSFKFQF